MAVLNEVQRGKKAKHIGIGVYRMDTLGYKVMSVTTSISEFGTETPLI